MADWKKVLVSGSDIHIKQITSSELPTGTSGDKVLVRDSSTGGFKTVTQGSIQGTTTANFAISGSTGNTIFDATGDILKFAGSNGATAVLGDSGNTTTVTFGLPAGTISGSQQIVLAQTNGFTSFSSSLATAISGNLANITTVTASLNTLETRVTDLAASSSQLIVASGAIASALNSQTSSIVNLQGSTAALQIFSSSAVTNSETGSFVISSSVVGTANEVEVTSTGVQGLQIGLPTNVTIGGAVEADNFIIQAENISDTQAATVSGSTQFGSLSTHFHRFTGSVSITGSLNVDNNGNDITINQLSTNNSALIGNIIVRDASTGQLHTAGTNIGSAISGAFGTLSGSFANRINNINTTTTTNNANDIIALQTVSASLLASASRGIHIKTLGNAGSKISLGESASFTAEGSGFTVSATNTTPGVNVNYKLDPVALGAAMGTFSSSVQLQAILDPLYVQNSDVPISSAIQLQNLGFITSSDFNSLQNIPSGLISGALDGTSPQGTIRINGNNVAIAGLSNASSPTFKNITVTNNLTVAGETTALNVENVNIEDQFILINSGATGNSNPNDKDGGIIVGQGDGKGALFMYDFENKAWGFRGAGTDSTLKVSGTDSSDGGGGIDPDVFVGTVSSSAVDPSAQPLYGLVNSTAKGQMHVNTADSTIWIYA
jgi:hypothetical protein